MKKMLLSLSMIAVLFGSSDILASDLKIGVVNFQQVLQSYPKVQATDEKLKKEFAPQQEKLVAMQKSLSEEVNKYNRDSAVMKEADKKTAEANIRDRANKYQTSQNEFQKKLTNAKNEAMKVIEQDVANAVNGVAKEQHFNLVLAKAAVGYNDAEFDITAQVIKKLKK